MQKSLHLLIFSIIITLLIPNSSMAEVVAAKSGYVNYEVAGSQLDEARKYSSELESEEKKISEAENKARQEIQAEVTKFQASAKKLDEQARATQEIALGKKIDSLEQQFRKARAELEQKRQSHQTEILKKMQLITDSIARERGFDFVLNGLMLVYVSENFKKNDITAEVVERYNKAYRPTGVKKPETQKKGRDKKSEPVKTKF